MFLKSQIRFIHVAPKKYDFFRLLYESDRIEFLFGKIMKYLSGNIRFSSEYLFVSRGSLEPVYLGGYIEKCITGASGSISY